MSRSLQEFWPHCKVAAATGITPDPIAKTITIVGAKTVETDVTVIEYARGCSYLLPYTTSDGAGTFKVLVCNNWDPDRRTGDFVDVTSQFSPTGATVAGANGACVVHCFPMEYDAIKIAYTQTSGTTVLKSSFAAKGL